MNKRGLLFVSILLILVSSAYALPDCNTRCKNQNQNYLFGQCGTESEMSKEGWENIGKTPCTGEQSCFCKKSVQITTQSTSQTNMSSNPSTPTEISKVDYFVIPNGLSGNNICKPYGGYCDSIQCRVDLSLGLFNPIYRWATVGCLRTGCDTEIENKPEGWARAYCSCSYDKFCNGAFVYEKKNTCQEVYVENCAYSNRKCNMGECTGCINGYYEENGVCIHGTRPTTTPSGDEPPITPPTQDSECTKLCETSAYNADIGYCLKIEKPQGPLSASTGTNPERIENKKINLDAQALTFTNQQKNCIGLIANDPGSQQDNEFETCFCVECGDNKKWENNKCIPCDTDETWDATTKKCVTKTEPAGAEKCGDGNLDSVEICDKQLTPTTSCISIDPDLYSSGTASCKQDCSDWDIINCITKTSPGTEKNVQISNIFCDNCIGDNFIYPNSPFTASCEVLFTPAQTSFGDIDFIEASFDNKKCTKITNEFSIFYFGCSSGVAQDSRKKLSCTINDQKATSKGYIRDGEDKNLNIKVTTEGNICQLTSAKIELLGTDNKADPGDKIKISAAVTGDCSSAKYFQLDAISSDNSCKIEYIGGTLSGFTKQNPTFPLIFEWTIPTDLKECIGKTVTATGVALWPDVPGKTGTKQIATVLPTGSFTFASALGGGQTKCGDGNLDSVEICDKQLTPTTSCISIDPDLYSSGTASCKQDCSGWDRDNCELKEIITGCGNGVVETDLGEDCDCGDPATGDIGCDQNELGRYKSCASLPSVTYPNAKLSCFPPGSPNQCKYNTAGCNYNKIPCFVDAECNSGEKCRPTDYYCYVPTSTPPVTPICIGNAPVHAQLCTEDNTEDNIGLTSDTQMSLVQACTSAKCEYICNTGFKLESGQCVQQTTIICGEGQIPATGCQCPSGTPKDSGYCCRNAQNNFVYSPDVPCGQEGLKTEGKTLASFKYDKKGIIVNFISTSIPSQGTVISYYEWDFGDDSTPIVGQGYKEITHTYQFDGSEKTFLVSLLVHDNKAGVDQWSISIKIEKSISDLPDTKTCNVRGKSLDFCHSSLDGCFLGSECESCAVVSTCDDFYNDELACTGEIPGCDRYACDWDNGNVCLPKQVSEQDCQYVCINLNDYPDYYFNGKKEYPQTCETGTCWECPTEGCKFTSPDGTTTITYIDGECVNGFKEVTIKNSGIAQDQKIIQPCSLSPVIPFFSLFNIILTLSILTVFYVFRKKF